MIPGRMLLVAGVRLPLRSSVAPRHAEPLDVIEDRGADSAHAYRRDSCFLAKKNRLILLNGLGGIRPGRGVGFGSYFGAFAVILSLAG